MLHAQCSLGAFIKAIQGQSQACILICLKENLQVKLFGPCNMEHAAWVVTDWVRSDATGTFKQHLSLPTLPEDEVGLSAKVRGFVGLPSPAWGQGSSVLIDRGTICTPGEGRGDAKSGLLSP